MGTENLTWQSPTRVRVLRVVPTLQRLELCPSCWPMGMEHSHLPPCHLRRALTLDGWPWVISMGMENSTSWRSTFAGTTLHATVAAKLSPCCWGMALATSPQGQLYRFQIVVLLPPCWAISTAMGNWTSLSPLFRTLPPWPFFLETAMEPSWKRVLLQSGGSIPHLPLPETSTRTEIWTSPSKSALGFRLRVLVIIIPGLQFCWAMGRAILLPRPHIQIQPRR